MFGERRKKETFYVFGQVKYIEQTSRHHRGKPKLRERGGKGRKLCGRGGGKYEMMALREGPLMTFVTYTGQRYYVNR